MPDVWRVRGGMKPEELWDQTSPLRRDPRGGSAGCTLRKSCRTSDPVLLQMRRSPWRDLCEYLKLAPPNAQYPSVNDIGIRTRQRVPPGSKMITPARRLRHDPSPWIAKLRMDWSGITASALGGQEALG